MFEGVRRNPNGKDEKEEDKKMMRSKEDEIDGGAASKVGLDSGCVWGERGEGAEDRVAEESREALVADDVAWTDGLTDHGHW